MDRCYQHDDVISINRCDKCEKSICEECSLTHEKKTLCPECKPKKKESWWFATFRFIVKLVSKFV